MGTIPAFPTIATLQNGYRRQRFSPLDVCEQMLELITLWQPKLNAFQHLAPESARAAATASSERSQIGQAIGPMDGIPLTIKDTNMVAGMPTRVGSKTTSSEPSEIDSPSVARLKEAGAIILGKTTTPEFGWKGITDSPLAGITRNPWNPDHSPGGSSGGAAAALAAGIGAIAHGTDGGGSIRIPASYCGLYGIKPSYGRVPHSPNDEPFATLVSNGPIARSVTDAAIMLNELKKPDHRDWRRLPEDPRDYTIGLEDGVRGWRIAYAPELGGAEVAPEIRRSTDQAVEQLARLGAEIVEPGPVIEPLQPVFQNYWLAGFASRIRGIDAPSRELLDPRFRSLAEEGLSVDAAAVQLGEAERARLGTNFNKLFVDCDILVTPTMPSTAPTIDTAYHSNNFDRWRDAVPFTVPFNLSGLPAASIPCGVGNTGLPIGLQIVGDQFMDHKVLRASRAFEATAQFDQPHSKLQEALVKI